MNNTISSENKQEIRYKAIELILKYKGNLSISLITVEEAIEEAKK